MSTNPFNCSSIQLSQFIFSYNAEIYSGIYCYYSSPILKIESWRIYLAAVVVYLHTIGSIESYRVIISEVVIYFIWRVLLHLQVLVPLSDVGNSSSSSPSAKLSLHNEMQYLIRRLYRRKYYFTSARQ